MSRHPSHRMHGNSLQAYHGSDFTPRERAILDVLRASPEPMTDRAIALRLGFSDLNAVRPRISEMLEGEILAEGGTVECAVSGKHVRTVKIANPVQETIW